MAKGFGLRVYVYTQEKNTRLYVYIIANDVKLKINTVALAKFTRLDYSNWMYLMITSDFEVH